MSKLIMAVTDCEHIDYTQEREICEANGIKSADELAFSLCTAVWGAVILLDPDDKDSCKQASENLEKTVETIFAGSK